MKINIVQTNQYAANPEKNIEFIKKALFSEENEGALLTVFPANNIGGFPLNAKLSYTDLQKRVQLILNECIAMSEYKAFIVGLPLMVQDRGLCNALVFVQNCAIRAVVTKKYLNPDEQRYLVRGEGFQIVQYHNQNIAIGFYEDIKDLLKYSDEVQPDMIVCCGSTVFDYAKPYRIHYKMQKVVEHFNVPLVYANRIGGEGTFLFAGGSLAMNAAGIITKQLPYFEEAITATDIQLLTAPECMEKPIEIELIYNALLMGIRDYFSKNNLQKALIGLSGGIDSAVVVALAAEALGPENVKGILMPSAFSSQHSIDDAIQSARNLGIDYDVVPINKVYDVLSQELLPIFENSVFGLTEENMQARVRGLMLMAISNKTGAVVLNTSNKSEAAVGYGTLYGDMCGGLSVIGDLYKIQVYELANWINRNEDIIPVNSIMKAPSAELRPDQKDTDSLPDYDILDNILKLYIEEQYCFEEIVKEGFDKSIVKKVLDLVERNEYKRLQAPPVIKVSPITFGIEWRTPIV